jgi:hypothetical protein
MLVRSSISALCALLLAVFAVPGCGNDSFNKRFDPTPPGDNDTTGELIPIQPGLTRSFQFLGTYKPSFSVGTGGLTEGEKQRSGYVCLQVDSVKDTATPAYDDAAETVVTTKVKINGGAGAGDIVVSDQDVTPPTSGDPGTVDGTLTNLWLTNLLVPSRGHGFSSPANVDNSTREPPVAPFGAPLTKLFYFDTRTAPDMSWGGWDKVNEGCPNYREQTACEAKGCGWVGGVCQNKTLNFLNKTLIYMMNNLGCVNFMSSDTKCRQNTKTPPSNCGTYSEQTTCMANNCTWAFVGNMGTGTCIGLYSLELMFRETVVSGPAELVSQGTIFHSLLIDYDYNGLIRHVAEDIGPDTNPSGPMKQIGDTLCVSHAPCAQAQLNLDDVNWGDAYCTF